MPGPNPDGTDTVDDIIVVGQRQRVFTVYPPSSVPPSPPVGPENEELPGGDPGEPTEPTECEREVTRDRAALEAAELIGGYPDNVEHGFFLVEDSNGSVRAIGPVHGYIENGVPRIDWDTTLAELGIDSWDRLVGLVHSHTGFNNAGGGYDGDRNEFSAEDVAVTEAFIQAGADPDRFRQYVTVDDDTYKFDADAEEGDEGTSANQVAGINNCG